MLVPCPLNHQTCRISNVVKMYIHAAQVQERRQQRNSKRAGGQIEQAEQVGAGIVGRGRPKRARQQVEQEEKETSEVNKRPRKARKIKAADNAALRSTR